MTTRTPVVVLDPGHGGDAEVGGSSPNNTSGGGLLEKHLTLDVARRVRDRLGGRATVLLTRDSDTNLSLAQRAGFARAMSADVFLSLHCNGHPDPGHDSTEVYVARRADARTTAFATTVQRAAAAAIGSGTGGVMEADLGVLLGHHHAPQTLVALLEMFDLTNPGRASAATDVTFLDAVAGAVAEAVDAHLPAPGAPATTARATSRGFGSPPDDHSPSLLQSPGLSPLIDELIAGGVPADEIENFLAEMRSEQPSHSLSGPGTQNGAPPPFPLPPVRLFSEWEARIIKFIARQSVLATWLDALMRVATTHNVTIGLGPTVSGGLTGGAGLSVGLVIAPGDQVGLYGTVAAMVGWLDSADVAVHATMMFGGPEMFGGPAVAIGGAVSVPGFGPMAGAHLLLTADPHGLAVGVTAEVGMSAGPTFWDAFAELQHTVTTLPRPAPGAGAPPGDGAGPAAGAALTVGGVSRRALDRSWIILGDDLTPQAQAFHPDRNDISGAVPISVRVPDLPSGGRVVWSTPPTARGRYSLGGGDTQEGTTVQITALTPGLTEIDVSVEDAGGDTVESWKLPLCVPQFVRVQRTAAFDQLLGNDFGLITEEVDDVVRTIKRVADELLLEAANVRTVWTEAPFNEPLPAQFRTGGVAADKLSVMKLEGNPPRPNLFGITRPPHGPTNHNTPMSAYPGAYDDQIGPRSDADGIDELTNEILNIIASDQLMSTPDKSIGMEVLGRLIGETVAHEIGHSLIGTNIGDGHNRPATPDGIMNRGGQRTLTNRTGFVVLQQVSGIPLDEMLQDRGLGAVNRFRGPAKAELDRTFPLPPTFSGTLGRLEHATGALRRLNRRSASRGRALNAPTPLTTAEWDLVTSWLAAGSVHGTALTGDAGENELRIAEAIWCARGSDRGSCVDGMAVVSHPEIEALRPLVSGRGPIIHWPARSLDQRRVAAMDLLVGHGYGVDAAAGIVGNLEAESGVLPSRIEGSSSTTPLRSADHSGNTVDWTPQQVMDRDHAARRGPRRPGIGLAQWTSSDRRTGLFTHTFGGQALGPAILFSMEAQIDYLVHEMRTSYQRVERVLTDPGTTGHDAADEVVYNFEIPGSILSNGQKLPRTDPAVVAVFEGRRSRADDALQAYRRQHGTAQGLSSRRPRARGLDDQADMQALAAARSWAADRKVEAATRRAAIVAAATAEYDTWTAGDGGRILENAPSVLPRLRAYVAAVNKPASKADDAAADNFSWSAALISYVMLQGGATPDLGFQPSAGHVRYSAEALANRLNRDHTRPFWLFRADEVAVEPGDLIFKSYGTTTNDFDQTFFNLHGSKTGIKFQDGRWQFGGAWPNSHADVVVDVAGGFATTIGGNTVDTPSGTAGNTVGKRRYRLDADGHVVEEVDNAGTAMASQSLWAVLKMLGDEQYDAWVQMELGYINALNGASIPVTRNTLIDVFGTGGVLPPQVLTPSAKRRAIFPNSSTADLRDIDLEIMFTPAIDPIPPDLA